MAQPNAAELQHFFELLYPDVEDGWLVLSHPDPARLTPHGKPLLLSDWFDLSRTTWQTIARAGQRRAQQYNLYFGVALQRPACDPGQFKRSKNSTAYIVPGLWFDLDLAYGHHAASALPTTDAEALDFLGALPAQPSLIVHSGGGMYGYWLFKEPYIITNEVEHEGIVRLSQQFTHTLVTWGKERGWTLDALGDMARVLRPPGSVNRKYDKVVEILHEGPERCNPSDFDWLRELPTPARATHAGAAITGQPDLVMIAEHYGATLERKSQSELAGTHPQHGSSTGDNFNINPEKGLWHCWRHGTGGDALALIAVCEGLMDCEHATSGALHGDLFKRVVTIANAKFHAGIQLNAAQQDGQQSTTATPGAARFQTIKATELYTKDLPDLAYIVPGILPVGETLFAGRGKDGKSLLAWNLCLAVATGGKALGCYEVEQGDVLYLALEDGERRAKKRLTEQMRHACMDTAPEQLELVLWDAPRIGEGFEVSLTTWLDEHPQAHLVVIDILEKVRPRRTRNGSVYADDYAALAPLQRLAQDRNIAILIVHHSNKTKPEDFRDTASGSMGLIGACDTFWSLQRIAGKADAALHIIGRDVDTQELAMQFQDGFWTVLGDADEYRMSQASKAVLDAMLAAGKPLTPKQLKDLLYIPEGTLRSRLSRMAERGEVLNIGDNRYIPSSSSSMGEGKVRDPATGATDATGATGATGATVEEKPGIVAPDGEKCNGGATVLSAEKDRKLDAVRCTVAPVAPGDALLNASSELPPCALCGGVERWNDRGTLRCSVCWPQRQGRTAGEVHP